MNLAGMSSDCGRTPEYPVRTHACMGRTCKLHAERPPAGNRTQDLLAARQQFSSVSCCLHGSLQLTISASSLTHQILYILHYIYEASLWFSSSPEPHSSDPLSNKSTFPHI
ncbi:hypothetical protein CHARACLAT_032226 [Characodon lateralis]|uniref:Uncharacterized protein n=1 Tax=Characodon lateralis TaxID=208331 RepID=A0ABU7E9I8_9TELE|nr:hypothetical protein [Characodon lateralis]